MDEPAKVEVVLRAGALNGERPGWDERRNKLFWVDIREPALHLFDPATRQDAAWELPAWIGCFSLDRDGDAVVALATGLYHMRLATGELKPLAHAPFDARRFIFNDGRCDPRGRFFAGAMYLPLKGPRGDGRSGAPEGRGADAGGARLRGSPEPGDRSGDRPASPLWRYDGDGRWTAVTDPVKTSNGLAWSPDGRTMYHADTDPKVVWAYDYDLDTGTPSNRRVFATIDVEDRQGGPDGASVDSEGFYWTCVFANGELLRFDPDGTLERRIRMPVKYPTMPAFGGSDLKTLFVTSATWPKPPEWRAERPDEGGLLALEAPVPGLPPNRFDPGAHP